MKFFFFFKDLFFSFFFSCRFLSSSLSLRHSIPQPSFLSFSTSPRETHTKRILFYSYRHYSSDLEKERREEEFCVDCDLKIVNRLVDSPMSKVEIFFLDFEHSFEIVIRFFSFSLFSFFSYSWIFFLSLFSLFFLFSSKPKQPSSW